MTSLCFPLKCLSSRSLRAISSSSSSSGPQRPCKTQQPALATQATSRPSPIAVFLPGTYHHLESSPRDHTLSARLRGLLPALAVVPVPLQGISKYLWAEWTLNGFLTVTVSWYCLHSVSFQGNILSILEIGVNIIWFWEVDFPLFSTLLNRICSITWRSSGWPIHVSSKTPSYSKGQHFTPGPKKGLWLDHRVWLE